MVDPQRFNLYAYARNTQRALARVSQDVVRELRRRCPDQKIAAADLGSTIIESLKKEAKRTCGDSIGH